MHEGSTTNGAAMTLATHLRDVHGIEPTSVTQMSVHHDRVLRVDRSDGPSWIARIHSPERPSAQAEGDVAVLRLLQPSGYPAERPATERPVSELDGAAVVVTEYLAGATAASGPEKITVAADLLGRLHALDAGAAGEVVRPGGAAGDDPRFEGAPRNDALAASSILDEVDSRVTGAARRLLGRLRELVESVDAGEGLPEASLHGNLLHDPDHFVMTPDGPVVINWRSAGIGPRVAELAVLLWGAEWGEGDGVRLAVDAYRRHVEPTAHELDRLDAVMLLRPLYLTCVDFRRAVLAGEQPSGDEWWWGLIDPAHIERNAAAARTAFSDGSRQ